MCHLQWQSHGPLESTKYDWIMYGVISRWNSSCLFSYTVDKNAETAVEQNMEKEIDTHRPDPQRYARSYQTGTKTYTIREPTSNQERGKEAT